jgi:putative membrane protein
MNTMTSSSSLPGTTIGYSDADIAGIIRTANQGEIDQGQAATSRASSDEVRAFARMMVSDHSNALTKANDLFSRVNITPNEIDLTRTLASNSLQTVSSLNTYSGADFDKKYIQSQIDVHQWLLNSLDSTLIPSAHNRQLRDFLQTQRSAVSMHLDRAKQIQQTIGS